MIINPFVAGILATVFAELIVFFVFCVISTLKSNKK